jgi:hypothetical protein
MENDIEDIQKQLSCVKRHENRVVQAAKILMYLRGSHFECPTLQIKVFLQSL